MKKLFYAILMSVSLFSCEEPIVTNSPAIADLEVFKDGKRLLTEPDAYKDNTLSQTLTIEIVPEIGKPFSLSSNASRSIFQALHLPLKLNPEYVCNSADCRKNISDIEPESFTMIVKNNNQELFNKKLKVYYSNVGKPFSSVKEVHTLNTANEWEKYRSSKLPITDENGTPTNYELQIPLWDTKY